MKDDDRTLPNGHTFLAITLGGGAHFAWAKATDPITAVRNAYKHHMQSVSSSESKLAVHCIYGVDDEIYALDVGGYEYKSSNPPTPIGLFAVTKNSIRAVKKGEFNDEHDDCFEWMTKRILKLSAAG